MDKVSENSPANQKVHKDSVNEIDLLNSILKLIQIYINGMQESLGEVMITMEKYAALKTAVKDSQKVKSRII